VTSDDPMSAAGTVEFRGQAVPWPRSVPTDKERALVKLPIANGYAHHLVCKCINNVAIRTYGGRRSSKFCPRDGIGTAEPGKSVLMRFTAAI
jgi:hypothetical protein